MKKRSVVDRFLPPVTDNINDWMTLWCFIGAFVTLVAWLLSMFFAPLFQATIFQVASFLGGLALGRISVVIVPQKNK
jgi:hypothetical protein